jgi:glycosyltransferase involved in cell wall biosynthesis
LEALGHGTPVLAANRASLPEVVGDAGLLVDPMDVDAIARGLSTLLFDQAAHAEIAERSKAQFARFSWARAARETLAVFEEAVTLARARTAHLAAR